MEVVGITQGYVISSDLRASLKIDANRHTRLPMAVCYSNAPATHHGRRRTHDLAPWHFVTGLMYFLTSFLKAYLGQTVLRAMKSDTP
jgi:hypothetical protein